MSLRIPEFCRVPGLVYGAHWSEPGVSGYYVGVVAGELARVAQSPAADECPCCEAHDPQVGEGPGFEEGCEECEEAVREAVREVVGDDDEDEELEDEDEDDDEDDGDGHSPACLGCVDCVTT